MRFSSPLRVVLASSLVSFAIAACGDDTGSATQVTPNGQAGAAGQSPGGSAGKAGSSAAGASAGGSNAGAAGASAGASGSGAAGASAGAGAAGSTAGAAGTTAGAAGSTAGAAGSTAGAAGSTAGAAGSSAGAAGSSAGAAGASAGGGAGQAGAAGANAGGAAGAGGQPVAQPQCGGIVDTCTLHDDCCNCLALGPGETAPVCDVKLCKASACELLGKPSTACNAGQCTLSLGCGAQEVTCKQKAPLCPKGEIAEVKDKCWTGKCIDTRDCTHVSSCSDCEAAGLSCVTISTKSAFPIVHCIDLPAICKEPSCDCLGPSVCTGSANLCSESKTGVTCSCPTC